MPQSPELCQVCHISCQLLATLARSLSFESASNLAPIIRSNPGYIRCHPAQREAIEILLGEPEERASVSSILRNVSSSPLNRPRSLIPARLIGEKPERFKQVTADSPLKPLPFNTRLNGNQRIVRENAAVEPEKKVVFESAETEPKFLGPLLAGVLELSGTVSLRKDTYKGSIYSSPLITIQDEDMERIGALHSLLRPPTQLASLSRRGSFSHKLVLASDTAVQLAKLMKPFAPSHLPAIEYYEWWENASTKERGEGHATFFDQERQRRLGVTTEQYEELLSNPYFFASILFWRGRQYNETNSRIRRGIGLTTSNVPLLEAIHSTIGGFKPSLNSGITYEWRVEKEKYDELMAQLNLYWVEMGLKSSSIELR